MFPSTFVCLTLVCCLAFTPRDRPRAKCLISTATVVVPRGPIKPWNKPFFTLPPLLVRTYAAARVRERMCPIQHQYEKKQHIHLVRLERIIALPTNMTSVQGTVRTKSSRKRTEEMGSRANLRSVMTKPRKYFNVPGTSIYRGVCYCRGGMPRHVGVVPYYLSELSSHE